MEGSSTGGIPSRRKKIMVNFGLNSASILGLFLAVAGAGLYFMRSVRPELSRDHDIFFAAVGLLCGLILMFQGWRLDPILQFSQFLLMGAAVSFAVETIRLRGATVEQARRGASGSYVDERPVSREYRAQLEELEPYDYDSDSEEERYDNKRRLRGYEEQRSPRTTSYESDEPRRTTRPRRNPNSPSSPTRTRRPRPSEAESYDEWNSTPSTREERPSRPRRPRSEDSSDTPPKRRPPRNTSPYMDEPPAPTEYVDYHPVDEETEETTATKPSRPSNIYDDDETEVRNSSERFDY
jgi:hypothetical protein